MLARKLALSSVLYSFPGCLEDQEEQAGRDRKTATLEELLDFTKQHFSSLSRASLSDMVDMVAANIFRSLARPPDNCTFEEEDGWRAPSWPHLHLVYDLLLTILEHPDFQPDSLKTVINKQFASHLFCLFSSRDAGEREVVKTVLHRIYGTFPHLRRFLRMRISSLLLEVVYDPQSDQPGAGELLEVVTSILEGASLPLSQEQSHLVERVVLPLHRADTYTTFAPQLIHCCCQVGAGELSKAKKPQKKLSPKWVNPSKKGGMDGVF